MGSFDGKTCSEVGQCKCKAGFEGKTCDRCRRGFFPYPQCNNQIRLSGGANAAEGFVEIKYVSYSSLWKGVCDDMANNKKKNNADVICKMAGYPLGSKTYHVESKPFGSGDGFLIDQLSCSGNENSVIDCGRNSLGSHDCEVGEYFGVTCLANWTFWNKSNSIAYMFSFEIKIIPILRKSVRTQLKMVNHCIACISLKLLFLLLYNQK